MAGISFDQPSAGNVNAAAAAFSVTNSGSGEAVHANSQGANAVHGDSFQGDAVVGIAHAQRKSGVLGIANDAPFASGVTGLSNNSNGVHGINGTGATPKPDKAAGVWGESDNGTGVVA